MLKEFIKEYKELYEVSFDEGFVGDFERFKVALCEPRFHHSQDLEQRLNFLSTFNHEPILVAVIGQFSSGKSSFLNALMGENILPTGVVPVTAKPTFIKYAPQKMIKAQFLDGSEEFLDIKELGAFVDQRNNLKSVKHINIYIPSEILKKVCFVDTPGLNSISSSDTLETQKIIKNVGGLIWISLIDNAARASELEDLKLIPKELKNNAICLLNQKDKLTQDELQNVLKHAQITYKEHFSKVIATSAKMQIEKKPNSGFDEVFDFIEKISSLKQDFVLQNCLNIKERLKAQYVRIDDILSELECILNGFHEDSITYFNKLECEYKDEFALLFENLKQNANLIADEINKALIKEEKSFFKSKKAMFNKENYEKITYERIFLKSDEVLSKLIYNDDKLSKIFASFKRKLSDLNQKITKQTNEIFFNLKDKILVYKAKYEKLRKHDELHSDMLFADIRKFSSEVYFLFLSAFEEELAKNYANLGLFFEKSIIKIAVNYQNAIKLSVNFIENKINKAADDYESDPSAFGLYYPKNSEIINRILTELSYYEFENDFIGNRPFISKFFGAINEHFTQINQKNLSYISTLKEKYNKDAKLLSEIVFENRK